MTDVSRCEGEGGRSIKGHFETEGGGEDRWGGGKKGKEGTKRREGQRL